MQQVPYLTTRQYVGRFAPSPSGPLHFGSLVGALASYLHAHQAGGRWLVRMDDIDPPREQPGAADRILHTLEAHGLLWHDSVLYQSQRLEAYSEHLQALQQQSLIYPCTCTRQQIRAGDGIYNNHCRPPSNVADAPLRPHALRLNVSGVCSNANSYSSDAANADCKTNIQFDDLIQGPQQQNIACEVGDFILRRKDGLPAYQLAVVVDDIFQNISHVIRGSDLLDSSARQLYLFQLFKAPRPELGHFPVATGTDGHKLSKQTHAPALMDSNASDNLWRALNFLHLRPPASLQGEIPQEQLNWAIEYANFNAIPALRGICLAAIA